MPAIAFSTIKVQNAGKVAGVLPLLSMMPEFGRRRLLTVCLLVLFLFLGLCGPFAADEFPRHPSATWKTASAESQGLDSAVLAEALDYVRTKSIPLHSFLIVRNGDVVLDAYFYPYTGRELHDVASVTKSFTSATIGIAIQQGYVKSVDQKVLSLLPPASADTDPRRQSLAIRHLLSMTSGLDCDTEGGEKTLAAIRHSDDWAAFALALPMRAEPGSRYAYCSCNNHVLSSIVTATTGKSLPEFAQKKPVPADRCHGRDMAGRSEWTYARLGRSAFASARHGMAGPALP